eukprot:15463291-Alexandrium_andersonii.AAC.1
MCIRDSIWDPVRILGRDRPPRAVRLDSDSVRDRAADTYAKYLEQHQWSLSGRDPATSSSALPPTSSVSEVNRAHRDEGVDPFADPITCAELTEIMRRIKTGKQGGPDEMKPEFVKWMGEEAK